MLRTNRIRDRRESKYAPAFSTIEPHTHLSRHLTYRPCPVPDRLGTSEQVQFIRIMLRIGTWNTQWSVPSTVRGRIVRDLLADPRCDILCVTEGAANLLPGSGYLVDAGSDWGCPSAKSKKGRRKVLLWSRNPWKNTRVFDERPLGGRFVAATTQTEAGPIDVLGVCIPWSNAHVATCAKDRKRWEEHIQWLAAFKQLPYRDAPGRTVVLGDFNQSIPRRGQNRNAYAALRQAFEGFTIPSAGWLSPARALGIDHIAHTPDLLRMGDIGIWPAQTELGRHLSDHFGVWCDFDDV